MCSIDGYSAQYLICAFLFRGWVWWSGKLLFLIGGSLGMEKRAKDRPQKAKQKMLCPKNELNA